MDRGAGQSMDSLAKWFRSSVSLSKNEKVESKLRRTILMEPYLGSTIILWRRCSRLKLSMRMVSLINLSVFGAGNRVFRFGL